MNGKLKAIFFVLIVIFMSLQYRLWVGQGSLADVHSLEKQLAVQKYELNQLLQQNEALKAEVDSLRKGDAAIEAQARSVLGYIGDGETYFQIIKPKQAKATE